MIILLNHFIAVDKLQWTTFKIRVFQFINLIPNFSGMFSFSKAVKMLTGICENRITSMSS